MKKIPVIICSFVAALLIGFSPAAWAGTISGLLDGGVWDGWTEFQDDAVFGGSEDYVGNSGKVDPGWGDQAFDAEYLLWRLDGTTLSIGLQAGFNLVDGKQYYAPSSKYYYAGDMSLSINGVGYALDFEFAETRDNDLFSVGGSPDAQGIEWNTKSVAQ